LVLVVVTLVVSLVVVVVAVAVVAVVVSLVVVVVAFVAIILLDSYWATASSRRDLFSLFFGILQRRRLLGMVSLLLVMLEVHSIDQ